MLTGELRPTTLDGIKSLAAQLRKEQGIKHSSALDIAARAANCTNFRNAKSKLPAKRMQLVRHYVLLTVYWRDANQQYQIGRETLKIELSKSILDICGKSALKYVRGFRDFRMVADDHFVCDLASVTQDSARRKLCMAERSLRFMEHTGLQPARDYHKTIRHRMGSDKLPRMDHSTDWFDPENGQLILIDEPYGKEEDAAERAAWAARTGWTVTKSSWPGMYFPYNADFYVVTDSRSGFDVDALVAKINAISAPLREEYWAGESSPLWDTFVSPMAKTAQDVRRARCRGTIFPTASAISVPYRNDFGSVNRRPRGELGIEGHIEGGRIIKAILDNSQLPGGAFNRMNSVRATLEDWLAYEIGRGQLEGPEFFEVYYHAAEGDGPFYKAAKSKAGMITMLGDLKQKLQAAYPDCAPLRRQLRRIDTTVSLIGKMKHTGD